MKIGITYDLKGAYPSPQLSPRGGEGGNGALSLPRGESWGETAPDDLQEEYDSPATIAAIAEVLRGLGHDVYPLGDGRELLEQLLARPPEFVFNIAEGQGVGRSREARVPAVLEMLGIPYTGSDPLTLAVTLDKDCAKRLAASAGVAVPRGLVLHCGDDLARLFPLGFPFPAIVKPAWEGSSKGIRNKCVVDGGEDLRLLVESLRRDYRQPVLVEEYIEGDELTVGMVGNDPPQVVGVMRVLPRQPGDRFIYSVEIKRDWERLVRYECPAPLLPAVTEAVCRSALAAYRVLGCRDVARLDFRLRDGVPYFLEVNPLPGLNPDTGDLVILAKMVGWTYPRLIATILQAALDRQGAAPLANAY
jgi:D-alanine-D-alanine ligase